MSVQPCDDYALSQAARALEAFAIDLRTLALALRRCIPKGCRKQAVSRRKKVPFKALVAPHHTKLASKLELWVQPINQMVFPKKDILRLN